MRQEDINQVLLEEAQKGHRVVRLKGGDPFLFGRGGEELELLEENGIAYEVVPGVTSSHRSSCIQRSSGDTQRFLFFCAHYYGT